MEADRDRVVQVVVNLLSNAVKFSDPGRGRVRLGLAVEDGMVRVDVSDNGPGIAAADQGIIFEKFRQGGDTASGRPAGTGLGLRSAGRSSTTSAAGCGWTASRVGAQRSPSRSRSPTSAAPRPGFGDGELMADDVTTRRVLIVDDEPNIVMSLEFLMRKSGFETSVARDGDAALAEVERFRPDLLLLDAMMPHRDGFEVCQQLRAAGWGDLKIIMLTAKGRETEIAKGSRSVPTPTSPNRSRPGTSSIGSPRCWPAAGEEAMSA